MTRNKAGSFWYFLFIRLWAHITLHLTLFLQLPILNIYLLIFYYIYNYLNSGNPAFKGITTHPSKFLDPQNRKWCINFIL